MILRSLRECQVYHATIALFGLYFAIKDREQQCFLRKLCKYKYSKIIFFHDIFFICGGMAGRNAGVSRENGNEYQTVETFLPAPLRPNFLIVLESQPAVEPLSAL